MLRSDRPAPMHTVKIFLIVLLCSLFAASTANAAQDARQLQPPSDAELLTQVQKRACRYFWDKADSGTGLVNDRARNVGEDDYTVASVASTGYALAALPIAVEHGWTPRQKAYDRALHTLQFIHDHMPQTHGWYFHFVDKRTGERVWNSEVSSIDTALLLEGALTCGQYFKGTEVQRLANILYDRIDWNWMLTNGGGQPDKLLIAHGWTPEKSFITNNWDSYCELMLLYLLGMGAAKEPLTGQSWDAWKRPVIEYKGHKTLFGGPIFVHQMAQGFYNFKNQRDRGGWDYWATSTEATIINRQYCLDNAPRRKTYGPDIWGLSANDYPDGYKAFAAPGDEDGTVSPTGSIASIIFTPQLSKRAAQALYSRYGDRLWGRYGFGDAFNVDRGWYDKDVIGIDLGMALINIENARTGLIWKLLASHPSTARAWKKAGFHHTVEPPNRPIHSP